MLATLILVEAPPTGSRLLDRRPLRAVFYESNYPHLFKEIYEGGIIFYPTFRIDNFNSSAQSIIEIAFVIVNCKIDENNFFVLLRCLATPLCLQSANENNKTNE